MLWPSLEGHLKPYHCSQTAIKYKNTAISVIAGYFFALYCRMLSSVSVNPKSIGQNTAPLINPFAFCFKHSICSYTCLLHNLDLQKKNCRDHLETSAYAQPLGNHFFDIDVVPMKMTVKNTTHLKQEKRNTFKSYFQV